MAYDDRDDDVEDIDIRKSRRQVDVPNYLTQAILITLCCCVPFGIVAIVHAAKVNTLLAQGDYNGAVRASEDAKKWCWIGFFLGFVPGVAYIALLALGDQL